MRFVYIVKSNWTISKDGTLHNNYDCFCELAYSSKRKALMAMYNDVYELLQSRKLSSEHQKAADIWRQCPDEWEDGYCFKFAAGGWAIGSMRKMCVF